MKKSAPRFAWLHGFLRGRLSYRGLATQRHAWTILNRVFVLTALVQLLPATASFFGVTTNPPGWWGYAWPALLGCHSVWFVIWLYRNKGEVANETEWYQRIKVVKAWQLGVGLIWCVPAFWLVDHPHLQGRTEHFMSVLVFCLVIGVISFPVLYGYIRVACPPVFAHVVASLMAPLPRTQITVMLVLVAVLGMALLARGLRLQLLRYLGVTQESERLLEALGQEYEETQAARSEAEATLGSVADGVVSSNPQLEISYINPQGADMLGEDSANLVGKSLLDVMPFLKRAEGIWVRAEEGPGDDSMVDAKYSEQQGVVMVERDGRHCRRHFGFSANLISEGRQAGGLVVAFRDITERIAMQRELEMRATTDQLTGILNRDGFGSRLQDVLDRVSVDAGSYALCYVDLDQIKVVNDSCGHPEGDRLLQQAAMLLERSMAEGEFAARIGGDEFAFLLSAKDSSALVVKAREIVKKIGQMGFVSGDKSFRTGASVGFVLLTRDHKDVDTAFKQADIACYVAKNSGGRQLYEYSQDAEFARNYDDQLDWLARVEDALENDRFRLYAQEICSTNGVHKHLEVLLSYRDDSGDYIGPSGIISAAERYGLMPEIDLWVVQNALDAFCDIFARGERPRYKNVCINLSAITISREEAIDEIVQMLDHTYVPAEFICFEITETAALNAMLPVDRFVRRLSSRGCKIALDDFGAGFSSFTALRDLPIDMMKVDGALVKDLNRDPLSRVVVEGIVRVAQKMGMSTVAEWVENQELLDSITEMGVDYAQGFYLSKRLPLHYYLEGCTPERPYLQVVGSDQSVSAEIA